MAEENDNLNSVAKAFIAATNSSDVERVLALFTLDAVIDDPSTGHRFDDHVGIRDYIERYFVDYHTVTRLVSMQLLGDNRASVRVDFTGDFGPRLLIVQA